MKHLWIIGLVSLLIGLVWPIQAQTTCGTAPAPQLVPGGSGIVVTNIELNVRLQPTTRSGEAGAFPSATIVTVLEGPVCADNYYWWRVRTRDLSGWIAEGSSEQYWVEPYIDPDGAGQPSPYADGLPPLTAISAIVPATARQELLYTALNPETGNAELRVYDVIENEIEVLYDDEDIIKPSWSPLGDQAAFVDRGVLTLYDIETDAVTPLTEASIATQDEVIWSPGYDYIAYTVYDTEQANADIYFVDVATGRTFNATPGTPNTRDDSFSWSPDGRWLSYTSAYFDRGITIAEVRLLDVTNGDSYRVGNFNARSRPIFSPTGVRLAFMIYDPEFGDSIVTPASLVVADILGGTILASYPGRADYDPAWSPDGTQVIYANDQSILIVSATGENVIRTIPFQGEIYDIGWSPDRSLVAFVAQPTADLVSAITPSLYIIKPDSEFPLLLDRNVTSRQVLWRPAEP